MNTTLTTDQVERYRNDGYLQFPAFLNAAEVAELKQAVLDAIATMGRNKVAGAGKKLVEGERGGESYYDRVFTQRLNLWKINDTVKRYMLSPEIGAMLKKLEGQNFRVWHDQALIKEPYANPTAWHLDNPYWSFSSRHAISIWIALEDATLSNGCMYFIPGSHKFARFETPGIGTNLGELFQLYPEMAAIDPVPAPMKAGDCSFHNALTAHGAGANMTRGRRIAMTCAYMPDGSTFNGNQNILPDDYFHSLKPGDTLANDTHNPRL